MDERQMTYKKQQERIFENTCGSKRQYHENPFIDSD